MMGVSSVAHIIWVRSFSKHKHISSSLHSRVTTIKSQDREKREIITARRHAVSITLCISSGSPARGLCRWVSARASLAPRRRTRCCPGRGLVESAAAAVSLPPLASLWCSRVSQVVVYPGQRYQRQRLCPSLHACASHTSILYFSECLSCWPLCGMRCLSPPDPLPASFAPVAGLRKVSYALAARTQFRTTVAKFTSFKLSLKYGTLKCNFKRMNFWENRTTK